MPTERAKNDGRFSQAWQWVKGQFVQEVPQDVALCEFDCRKLQCTMGEWETCARRLETLALQKQSSAPKSSRNGAGARGPKA